MRRFLILCLVLLPAVFVTARQTPTSSVTVFEGARLITGDGSAPIDLALSLDNVLYSLTSGDHRISAFQVLTDGSLAPLGSVPAPPSANGLAAR